MKADSYHHKQISEKGVGTDENKSWFWGLPAGPVVRNLLASAGEIGLIPALGRPHMLQGS